MSCLYAWVAILLALVGTIEDRSLSGQESQRFQTMVMSCTGAGKSLDHSSQAGPTTAAQHLPRCVEGQLKKKNETW
jgi:hypothetical protein